MSKTQTKHSGLVDLVALEDDRAQTRQNATPPHENYVTLDCRVHNTQVAVDITTMVLRDEDSFITARVTASDSDAGVFEIAKTLIPESIVRVSGTVRCANTGSSQEILVSKIVVRAHAAPNTSRPVADYEVSDRTTPAIQLPSSTHLVERLNNRVADVKVAANGAIFKLFSGIMQLVVEHQTSHGFNWISTPSLINYRIPGDDDYFPVSYFDDKDVHLAQTGEFHLQIALAMDLKRVFEIRNVFRREPKVSSRHLTEYTAFEVMMAFDQSWLEVLHSAESLLSFVIQGLQKRKQYRDQLSLAKKLYSSAGDFKLGLDKDGHCLALTFHETKRILREHLNFDSKDNQDLTSAEEAALGRLIRSPTKPTSIPGPPTDMFVITDWPAHLRPFNVHGTPGRPGMTNSFDIILRGQETCSGWQSIHDYKMMREAMVSRDPAIDPDAPMWRPYVGAYEAGAPPQGGFGMGLNRLLQNVLGLSDIHEAALFPRNAKRVAP